MRYRAKGEHDRWGLADRWVKTWAAEYEKTEDDLAADKALGGDNAKFCAGQNLAKVKYARYLFPVRRQVGRYSIVEMGERKMQNESGRVEDQLHCSGSRQTNCDANVATHKALGGTGHGAKGARRSEAGYTYCILLLLLLLAS